MNEQANNLRVNQTRSAISNFAANANIDSLCMYYLLLLHNLFSFIRLTGIKICKQSV